MRASRGPQVANAIAYLDNALGRIVSELKQRNLYSSTAIIVTAKHGQSPTDHSMLVKNGDTLSKLLEASNYLDPNGNFGQNSTKSGNLNDGTGLVGTGFVQTDDIGLIWLRDQSQLPAVVKTLKDNLNCNAPGICADGPQAYILYGPRLNDRFGEPARGRTPDIVVQPNPGSSIHQARPRTKNTAATPPTTAISVSWFMCLTAVTLDGPTASVC